jgi:hypothetical protein
MGRHLFHPNGVCQLAETSSNGKGTTGRQGFGQIGVFLFQSHISFGPSSHGSDSHQLANLQSWSLQDIIT